VLITLAILLISFTALTNQTILTQKPTRDLAADLARLRLQEAKPDALIICTNDVDCYTLFYYRYVENVRPDLMIIPHMPVYTDRLLSTRPDLYPYTDNVNPDYFAQLVAFNVGKQPVYFTGGLNFYSEYAGVETGPFYSVPHQSLFEITATPPASLSAQTLNDSFPSITSFNPADTYSKGIVETIANRDAYAGYVSLLYGQPETATAYLQSAATLDPTNRQTQELVANLPTLTTDLKINPIASTASEYITAAKAAESDQNFATAYKLLRFATYKAPTDPHIIGELADFLIRQNFPNEADRINRHRLLFESK
jgi:hypothetical protein